MKQLVIIGASGHGKVAADIAQKNGYEKIVFLDDNESINSCGEYSVEGKSERATEYDCDVFVAIGDALTRCKFQKWLEDMGVNVPVLVHPSAVVADSVTIGAGTVVVAGAVINPGSVIGKGCIINTCSSVDHDCMIGDYVHVAVGAHVAGNVRICEYSWIGAGAVVSNKLEICSDCMIGAGAVVVKSIYESGTYVGVPAKRINNKG